ncbi:MAG TPA: TetR/AcrR family transcriptional regulator [Oculatellaceae cyanobacterium]
MIGRRAKKREATKQEILEAAARLFAARGFDATSVEDISEAADVAKGTFYYNFQSKEDVVIALRISADDDAVARAQSAMIAGRTNSLTILERLICEATQWSEDNPELARVFFTRGFEVMHRSFEKEKSIPRLPAVLPDLISVAQRAGELRADVPAALLAEAIMHIFITTQASWVAKGQSSSVVEQVRTMFKVLVEGIGNQQNTNLKQAKKKA